MNQNFNENLPAQFIRNITGLYGAKGKKWLAKLPESVDKICTKWSLEIEKVFSNLSFNFVAVCFDGLRVARLPSTLALLCGVF